MVNLWNRSMSITLRTMREVRQDYYYKAYNSHTNLQHEAYSLAISSYAEGGWGGGLSVP